MSSGNNLLDGSIESDYSDASSSDNDGEEIGQLGHCHRDCFPLVVPEEMWHCVQDGLHLVVRVLGAGNDEDIATIVQLYEQENFFHQAEGHCSWTECPPGLYVGTLVTDHGSKLFCVHRIAEMVYMLENLDYALWS